MPVAVVWVVNNGLAFCTRQPPLCPNRLPPPRRVARYRPYRREIHNTLEMALMVCAILIFLTGLISFATGESPEDRSPLSLCGCTKLMFGTKLWEGGVTTLRPAATNQLNPVSPLHPRHICPPTQ